MKKIIFTTYNYCRNHKKIYYVFILHLLLIGCKNKRVDFNKNGIYAAFYDDKYKKIFVGNGDGDIKAFSYDLKLISKKKIAPSSNKNFNIIDMRISNLGNRLINTSNSGTVYIWNVTNLDSITLFSKDKLHNSSSLNCGFDHNDRFAVSTGNDSSIVVRDFDNPNQYKKLSNTFGPIRFVWFSYDSKFLYSCNEKGYIHITDTDSWTTTNLKIADCAINCLVCNKTNSTFVCALDNGEIKIVDFKTLKTIQTIKGHNGPTYVTEYYDVDREKISSTGFDGYIRTWKIENGIYVLDKEVLGHNSPCCTLFYNDLGTELLSGGQDGYIKRWDSKSLKLIKSVNVNGL